MCHLKLVLYYHTLRKWKAKLEPMNNAIIITPLFLRKRRSKKKKRHVSSSYTSLFSLTSIVLLLLTSLEKNRNILSSWGDHSLELYLLTASCFLPGRRPRSRWGRRRAYQQWRGCRKPLASCRSPGRWVWLLPPAGWSNPRPLSESTAGQHVSTVSHHRHGIIEQHQTVCTTIVILLIVSDLKDVGLQSKHQLWDQVVVQLWGHNE